MRPDQLTSLDLTDQALAPNMLIEVRSGIGFGPTELAAFDDALGAANIANFNLIRLSSVIPPESRVKVLPDPSWRKPEGQWGDRLYVVMAEQRSSTAGQTAAAGIGWVQAPTNGQGLFVEHEGSDAASVRGDIGATLASMMQRRGESFGPIQHRVVEAKTPDDACMCVMVVATFESQPWTGTAPSERHLN